MTEVMAVLILFMIVSAIVAVETSRLLFSVISVGAVGFLLAIAFLFLGAPDVAIVQIGVEVASLVILVRATIGREARAPVGGRVFVGSIAAVAFVAGIGLLVMQTFAEFPDLGRSVTERFANAPAGTYLREGLALTGAPNAVTGVLLDFRAFDTLGEVTVLFCAVLGAITLLRRRPRTTAETGTGENEDDPQ